MIDIKKLRQKYLPHAAANSEADVRQDLFECIAAIETLQSQLAAEKKAVETLTIFLEDAKKQIRTVVGRWQSEKETNRWIPVGERLPEKTEEDLRPQVLVFDGESVTGALWRHYDCGWDFETGRGNPTHWRPIHLPEEEEAKP